MTVFEVLNYLGSEVRRYRELATTHDLIEPMCFVVADILQEAVELLETVAPAPALDADTLEWVRIEARLRQAKADGLIDGWGKSDYEEARYWACSSVTHMAIHFQRESLLESAQAAQAAEKYLDELEAEAAAKKLPEPEAMAFNDLLATMESNNYELVVSQGYLAWRDRGKVGAAHICQGPSGMVREFHVNAVRRVRELAAQNQP